MNINISKMINRFEVIFSNVADLLILNTLFIVFSLPIFTIGASTTALYRVVFVKNEGEKVKLIRCFIRNFKENFKRSTGIWMILFFLVIDGYILHSNLFVDHLITQYIVKQLGKILCVLSMYIFGLEAYFNNSIRQTLFNSIILFIRYFPTSLVFYLLFEISWRVTYYIYPPLFFVVFGLIAYINTLFLKKIFNLIIAID